MKRVHLLPAILCSFLAACGSSDPDAAVPTADAGDVGVADSIATDSPLPDSAPSDVSTDGAGPHDVAYVPASDLTVGKSAFQLRITRGGAPATGLASSIVLSPVMVMEKMSHGNPVPIDAIRETATPGLYDATLFFTMASVDMTGAPLGQWKLGVTVGDEAPVNVDLMVKPHAGAETTHVMLKNEADTLGSSKLRNYVLFRDTLEKDASGVYTLGVFLATVQDGMMVWPPVTTGLELKDMSGAVKLTISTVELSASLDGTSWSAMPCDAKSRCRAPLAGLASGATKTVFVKMKINGKDYTTDGFVPDGTSDPTKTNAFGKFTVTTGS